MYPRWQGLAGRSPGRTPARAAWNVPVPAVTASTAWSAWTSSESSGSTNGARGHSDGSVRVTWCPGVAPGGVRTNSRRSAAVVRLPSNVMPWRSRGSTSRRDPGLAVDSPIRAWRALTIQRTTRRRGWLVDRSVGDMGQPPWPSRWPIGHTANLRRESAVQWPTRPDSLGSPTRLN